ncbi:OsmC family protein [Pseudonocardia abyssalis]|uniref:OsmC family protein n=1 Tax=Pseudonocardia abyssalis TaxID=2792008 RepID=A0ABS6UQC0_9PSEU|nr:OsmC family protein [Pseudonocardia abyssalis]MBW0117860.1 OsmC family protein [Pseudonocardia abyssalis]MBW0134461.1 OsmC family protein [Pseudonocardia abyssalis]
MIERTVSSRWDGGLRAVVDAGGFELVVDEPESVEGGTGKGPQPTELLLASVASCMTLAMAYSARKREVELVGLDVVVTGTYDGPQFSALRITVTTESPTGEELDKLVASAERVCYVTRTLKLGPAITVVAGQPGDLAQG